MTLTEQLRSIKERISNSRVDIISALQEKGVTVDSSILLSEIAAAIRDIHQSDFTFIFDFKNIDQFGNPHVPNTGSLAHGMSGLSPDFVLTVLNAFIFDDESMQLVQNIKGEFGVSTVGFNPAFDLEQPDVYSITLDKFTENQLPEVLTYE